MTYQESKEFEEQQFPKQKPEFISFVNSLVATLGDGWKIQEQDEPKWQYDWNYRIDLEKEFMRIRLDFSKGSLFAPVRCGRLTIGAFSSHELHGYSDYSKSHEISLSLQKDIFRIVAEIKSRLLPVYLLAYAKAIDRKEKQRAQTAILYGIIDELQKASDGILDISPAQSETGKKPDEISQAQFYHYEDEGSGSIHGTVYSDSVRFEIKASPQKAAEIVRTFFSH
jgi:hypothetical protein